jgi:hypothetical protein
MRLRLLLVVLLVAVASLLFGAVGSVRAAQPEATCMLPGVVVPCLTDVECEVYGATCDVTMGACVCAPGDGGSSGDLGGSADLGGGSNDLGTSPGGNLGGTGPHIGGGMTGPPRSAGCSFVPGSI